jgi:hypothetical protein
MATRKAATTEDLTAEATDLSPTLEDRVADIVDATDPSVVAKVDEPKYVKVKSPAGDVTTVPEGIVDALVESGYSKTK